MFRSRLPGCAAIAAALLGGMAFGEPGSRNVGAGQIAAAVAQLRADIDAFRFVMGAPIVTHPPWVVAEAAPRHTLYTAETLFVKVNRLAHEVAGEPRTQPPAPAAATAEAALNLIAAAHEKLRSLMARVDVAPANQPQRRAGDTFADALVNMVEANRQLNAMLVHEYRPAEIYGLVIESMAHVACVSGNPYPGLPSLEVGFTSTDVYRRLLESYRLLRQAEAVRDVRGLALNLRRERRRQNVPASDVYDLSRLLLADVTSVACQAEAGDRAAPPYPRPGYVHSAHVHRLAGVLEGMLRALAE